jgi:hypothetical protein
MHEDLAIDELTHKETCSIANDFLFLTLQGANTKIETCLHIEASLNLLSKGWLPDTGSGAPCDPISHDD